MDSIRFGRTRLKTSWLCLGTMGIGASQSNDWVLDEDRSRPILEKAPDVGVTFFDMADWYSTGLNEEIVGCALLAMPSATGWFWRRKPSMP